MHDALWPFFAMLQYNNGAILRFLLVRNPVSLLYGGVFPSVLRYVLLQGNAQPQDKQVLYLPHGHARRPDRASISGNDLRT
jgi:hypothetical protein